MGPGGGGFSVLATRLGYLRRSTITWIFHYTQLAGARITLVKHPKTAELDQLDPVVPFLA